MAVILILLGVESETSLSAQLEHVSSCFIYTNMNLSKTNNYCIPIQICIEFSDLIGREAVRTEGYGLAYGPANDRSGTRHQIYYFRHVIGEISSVRMWSSISSLQDSKSNVRHEETVLVSSMLFQVRDWVKTLILFSQIKRFINVWQACLQDMLKRRIIFLGISWFIHRF